MLTFRQLVEGEPASKADRKLLHALYNWFTKQSERFAGDEKQPEAAQIDASAKKLLATLQSVKSFYTESAHLAEDFGAAEWTQAIEKWAATTAKQQGKEVALRTLVGLGTAVLKTKQLRDYAGYGVLLTAIESATKKTLTWRAVKNAVGAVGGALKKGASAVAGGIKNYVQGIAGAITSPKSSFTQGESAVLTFRQLVERSLQEKWGGDVEIKQTGEYADKTVDELCSMRSRLLAKTDRTDADSTKLKQINFALRAKQGFGKVQC